MHLWRITNILKNKQEIGKIGEDIACSYLEKNNYKIICRNYRTKTGEIDIIAKEAEYLCFIEVKYRRDRQCGDPLEAVDYRKQKNIVQTALYYMMKNGLNEWTPCRFDVVSVCGGQVRVIKNAFEGV